MATAPNKKKVYAALTKIFGDFDDIDINEIVGEVLPNTYMVENPVLTESFNGFVGFVATIRVPSEKTPKGRDPKYPTAVVQRYIAKDDALLFFLQVATGKIDLLSLITSRYDRTEGRPSNVATTASEE